MSEAHAAGAKHKPHVLPVRIYAAVWVGLLALTVITVWVAGFDFGMMNVVLAMAVATTKAALVVLFFMHLKYDERFNVIIFVSSLVFLWVFFMLTLADTVERGKVDPIEARAIELVPARPELMRLAGDGQGDGHGAGDAAEQGGVSGKQWGWTGSEDSTEAGAEGSHDEGGH